MNSSMAAQFIEMLNVDKKDYLGKHIEGKRYASNEKQGYVLIKNVKNKGENALFHTTLDDEYARFKEREESGTNLEHFQKLEREPAKFQVLADKNALRKRLKSDSSDEGIEVKAQKMDGEDMKNEVEFMSSSSSSSNGSDTEQTITEQKEEEKSNLLIETKEIKDTIDDKLNESNNYEMIDEQMTKSEEDANKITSSNEEAIEEGKTKPNEKSYKQVSTSQATSETPFIVVLSKELEETKDDPIIIPDDSNQTEQEDTNKNLSSLSLPLDHKSKQTNDVDDNQSLPAPSSNTASPAHLLSPVDSEKSFISVDNRIDDQQPGPSSAVPLEVR